MASPIRHVSHHSGYFVLVEMKSHRSKQNKVKWQPVENYMKHETKYLSYYNYAFCMLTFVHPTLLSLCMLCNPTLCSLCMLFLCAYSRFVHAYRYLSYSFACFTFYVMNKNVES
uniref:Uncharacterized protein n=1 Tax=Cacopsylla melanoneura TaxID=428564 RepID=A0A8D8TGE0_9HEMI